MSVARSLQVWCVPMGMYRCPGTLQEAGCLHSDMGLCVTFIYSHLHVSHRLSVGLWEFAFAS